MFFLIVSDSLPSSTPQSNQEVPGTMPSTIPHVPAAAPASSSGLYSSPSTNPLSSSRLYSSPPAATNESTPSQQQQQQQQNGLELRRERVYVTLLRDHTGLGFSIGGGKGGSPFKDGSEVSRHSKWCSFIASINPTLVAYDHFIRIICVSSIINLDSSVQSFCCALSDCDELSWSFSFSFHSVCIYITHHGKWPGR